MALRFFVERVVLNNTLPQPERGPTGDLEVPQGQSMVFRLRVSREVTAVPGRRLPSALGETVGLMEQLLSRSSHRPDVPTFLLPRERPAEAWRPFRLHARSGSVHRTDGDNAPVSASWAEAQGAGTPDGQFFVWLDLPPVVFDMVGSMQLQFTTAIPAPFVGDWMLPAEPLTLDLRERVRVVRPARARTPTPPPSRMPLGAIGQLTQPIQFDRTNPQGGWSMPGALPATVEDARRVLAPMGQVFDGAHDSRAFDRFVPATNMVDMDNVLGTLATSIERARDDRLVSDFETAVLENVISWFAFVPYAPPEIPELPDRLENVVLVDFLRWVPIIGDAIALLEGFAGEEMFTGRRLGALESTINFGAGLVGLVPILGDLVAAFARRGARVAGRAIGGVLETVAERFVTVGTRFERWVDSELDLVARTLNHLDRATGHQLSMALDYVRDLREMLRETFALAAAVASQTLRNARDRIEDGLRRLAQQSDVPRRAMLQANAGRRIAGVTVGAFEVNFIRRGSEVVIGICL